MRWCETFGTAARVRFIKGAIVERYFGRDEEKATAAIELVILYRLRNGDGKQEPSLRADEFDEELADASASTNGITSPCRNSRR